MQPFLGVSGSGSTSIPSSKCPSHILVVKPLRNQLHFLIEIPPMQISENGVISFERPFPDPFPRTLPLTSSPGTSTPPPLIAGFWGDINVPKNGGAIFFIEMNERINGRFGRARAHVLNLLREGFGRSMEDFYPTHIFLCTWESVHENNPGVAKRVSIHYIFHD